MTTFTFTDDYDEYGCPLARSAWPFPGAGTSRSATGAGEPYLGTRTSTTYAQRDDDGHYIVDRVARTTTHEILNDGSAALLDLLDDVRESATPLAVTGQSVNHYDGDAFEGLPCGQLGEFGALVRTETLMFTEALLEEAYRSDDGRPCAPYRDPSATVPDEYPAGFLAGLLDRAGYTFHAGDADHERGYFCRSLRCRYDVHDAVRGRGLVTVNRDPLGRDATLHHDRFGLLPEGVDDAVGLPSRSVNDYRVCQPRLVTDPNGNRTAFTFTPLGMLESITAAGPDSQLPAEPDTLFDYDLLSFTADGRPTSVRTVRRAYHAGDPEAPADERDATLESVEYIDGFGRVVQSREQADDAGYGDPVRTQVLPTDSSAGAPIVPTRRTRALASW